MRTELGVKTIKDLAKWKHYRLAKAIKTLADTEVEGARPAGAAANINSGIDQAFETASLNELLAAPPSALQGLASWCVVHAGCTCRAYVGGSWAPGVAACSAASANADSMLIWLPVIFMPYPQPQDRRHAVEAADQVHQRPGQVQVCALG